MTSLHRHPEDTSGALSTEALRRSVTDFISRFQLDRTAYHVPYLAGYNQVGDTIYIDKRVPPGFEFRSRFISTDRFLKVHEGLEKSLMLLLGLHYLHAHQLALREEEAAVEAEHGPEGLAAYNKFMDHWIGICGREGYHDLPPHLDLTPYREERDPKLGQILHRHVSLDRAAKG